VGCQTSTISGTINKMSKPSYQIFLLCPFKLNEPHGSAKRQNITITPAPSRNNEHIYEGDPVLIEFDCDGLDPEHFIFRDVNWDLMSRRLTDLLTAAIGHEFLHIGTVKSGSPSQILKLLPFSTPRTPVVGLRVRQPLMRAMKPFMLFLKQCSIRISMPIRIPKR
jgi:hypothetical protein